MTYIPSNPKALWGERIKKESSELTGNKSAKRLSAAFEKIHNCGAVRDTNAYSYTIDSSNYEAYTIDLYPINFDPIHIPRDQRLDSIALHEVWSRFGWYTANRDTIALEKLIAVFESIANYEVVQRDKRRSEGWEN